MESGQLHRPHAGQQTPSNRFRLSDPIYAQRGKILAEEHAIRLASFTELASSRESGTLTDHQVGAAIKSSVPADTVFVIEAVTCVLFRYLIGFKRQSQAAGSTAAVPG